MTAGRSLRNLHNRADAAPEWDQLYPDRSATSVTGLRTGVQPTAGVRAGQHDWRKAVERFGNPYKADEFEYQAVTRCEWPGRARADRSHVTKAGTQSATTERRLACFREGCEMCKTAI